MINLFQVHMNHNRAMRILDQTLQSGYIGEGPRVAEFEEKLAALWALPYDRRVVAVNSCTSALDMALTIAERENGGDHGNIVTTPMTCLATNVNLDRHGHQIRWADVDPLTGLISLDSVMNLVDDNTIAVISVQYGGHPVDPRIAEFLEGTTTFSIEDAAHGILTPSNADIICYSFQAIKHLTTGDGGALVVPRWYEKEAKRMRWYGLDRTKAVNFRADQNVHELGFKYHMNDIAASIGLANIDDAHWLVERSRGHARMYDANFKDLTDVRIIPLDWKSSYWLYTVHVENRPRFIKHMADHGVEAASVHSRNDWLSAFLNNPLVDSDYGQDPYINDLQGVDKFHGTQVNIPVRGTLSAMEVLQIINAVRSYRHAWNDDGDDC